MPVNKEKVVVIMGGSAPQAPRDLSLFSSGVDDFPLVVSSDCRTMERLDRRIGPRRDATRAPIQARSGRRPAGRLLVNPLHHLRTGKILSKRWGPPHCSQVEVKIKGRIGKARERSRTRAIVMAVARALPQEAHR